MHQGCTSDPGRCHRRTRRQYAPGHIPETHTTHTLSDVEKSYFSEFKEFFFFFFFWERTLCTCSRSFFTRNNIFIQEFVLWLDTSVLIPFRLDFLFLSFSPHFSSMGLTSNVQTKTNLIISQNGLLPLEGSKDMHPHRHNQLSLNPATLNTVQVGI